MSQEMQDCISNCMTCHAICLETIHHCLQMGGEHASARHIGLLQDCAQICVTSADFMLRMSSYHPQTCGVCADVCEACAVECERLADGNDFMQRCADACRRCAESCRRMASGTTTSASM
jgi:hypothetical protein